MGQVLVARSAPQRLHTRPAGYACSLHNDQQCVSLDVSCVDTYRFSFKDKRKGNAPVKPGQITDSVVNCHRAVKSRTCRNSNGSDWLSIKGIR